jgi:hypothetical protein
MYFLNKLKVLFIRLFKKNQITDVEKELPNLYGSGGGISYVKGFNNEGAQALFVAWDKKQKEENREGYDPYCKKNI